MTSLLINGELPLLKAQALSEGDSVVIQVRCPAGVSVMKGDDAYDLAQNILQVLREVNFETARLKKSKQEFTDKLAAMTDNDIIQSFADMGCKIRVKKNK